MCTAQKQTVVPLSLCFRPLRPATDQLQRAVARNKCGEAAYLIEAVQWLGAAWF